MERQSIFKRVAAFLLMLCLLGSTVLGVVPIPVSAESASITVYFLNSGDWAVVGAHAWNDAGELTGG